MGEKGLTSSESQTTATKPQTDTPNTHPEWGPPNSKPDALGQIATLGQLDIDTPVPPAVSSDEDKLPPNTPVDDIKGDSIDEKDKPPEVM
ncbi:MAG TPA: hypothetical protein VLX61_11980 [Anaerolineales bacterium]|nr:hypothetical protein [Anaerolineales bacterium]